MAELDLKHFNVFLIDLDSDTLYIFDDETYRWLWSTDCSVDEDEGEASHILQGCPLGDITMICQVLWWSEWSDSNSNLAKVRESVSSTTAIKDGKVVWVVLPILMGLFNKFVKDYACAMEAAFLASGEMKHHPAHVKSLPHRRVVPFNEKENFTNKLVETRRDEDDHDRILVVPGEELSPSRMVIIGSGATYDMLNKVLVEARFPKFMRGLLKTTEINTANGKAAVDKGVRICSGPWDCASDAMLMENSPNRTSLGQRTMHAGFSFIWARGRFPCFRDLSMLCYDHHLRPARSYSNLFTLYENLR